MCLGLICFELWFLFLYPSLSSIPCPAGNNVKRQETRVDVRVAKTLAETEFQLDELLPNKKSGDVETAKKYFKINGLIYPRSNHWHSRSQLDPQKLSFQPGEPVFLPNGPKTQRFSSENEIKIIQHHPTLPG